jgi:radical SAM superfamily enzyme YgiQ (UPF0313 family)
MATTIGAILHETPDLVGITAKTINVFNAARIARQLKEWHSSLPIVVGGSHVSAVPVETLTRFSEFDYGVIGEGENTFRELIERISNQVPVNDVRGIVYRNDGEGITITSPRTLIDDLDSIPFPAWDLLPNFPGGYPHSALETKREPAASIMTSRGCPFQCTFCDNRVFGQNVRHHSADYVLEMVRYLKRRYGIRDLMILDDNFILDKNRLFQICEAFIREQIDLSWYCMGHTKFMTEDRLRKIKEAGCWIIEVGIESGCDRVLKMINKKTAKTDIAVAVRTAHEAGLKVKGNFIFGLPTESRESLEETIQFATSIPLSYFQQNFLTVWPGCRLADIGQQFGSCESDWSKLAHQRITFVPKGLSQADLIKASKKAFRRFYLRPRIILECVLSIGSWRALKSVIAGAFTFTKTLLRQTQPA